MGAFTGTGRLVLLALRRDRVKLPVWILAIVGLMLVGPPAIKEIYGGADDTMQYALTTSASVIARMFGGPVDGPNLGSVIMVEYFLFTAVLVAFMSTLAIVRHTRQNEETGRAELIGSAVVGRHAMLTAAILVIVGANIIVATAIGAALIASGLPENGSLIMAAGIGGTGIVFASIAAVTAQISGSARGANSLAGAIIGATFLLRAVGDGLGEVARDGLSASSMWLSWLSPFGWGQQAHPFTEGLWWPLGLYATAFVLLTGVAFFLVSRRDNGLGMVAARRGAGVAARRLLSPIGLAWRLQKGVLIGWTIGMVVMGITIGVTAIEFKDFFKNNEQLAAIFMQTSGATADMTDIFFSAMMSFVGLLLAGYALQTLLRLRSEEAAGQLEMVLATATGRVRWMMSHVTVALAGIVVLSLATGIAAGISYMLIAGEEWSEVSKLIGATFVQVPAVLSFMGVVLALFGLLPRLAIAASWGLFAGCVLLVELGELLKLPDWVRNTSPFSHTPSAPADDIALVPLVIMIVAALVLGIAGLLFFRRRDVTTS